MTDSLVVPDIRLVRAEAEPLRQQIYAQVAGAIRRGGLPAGRRLPSSRLLAKLLGVSRTTVVEAYERLLEEGWILARARRGVVVGPGGRGTMPEASGPGMSRLRRIARAAQFPGRTILCEDPEGTGLLLNVSGSIGGR